MVERPTGSRKCRPRGRRRAHRCAPPPRPLPEISGPPADLKAFVSQPGKRVPGIKEPHAFQSIRYQNQRNALCKSNPTPWRNTANTIPEMNKIIPYKTPVIPATLIKRPMTTSFLPLLSPIVARLASTDTVNSRRPAHIPGYRIAEDQSAGKSLPVSAAPVTGNIGALRDSGWYKSPPKPISFVHGCRLPFAGHLQKSFAKPPIINAVGKSNDTIARVVVHFFVRYRDTHAAPLTLGPCAIGKKNRFRIMALVK
jgi:hypothetical protein